MLSEKCETIFFSELLQSDIHTVHVYVVLLGFGFQQGQRFFSLPLIPVGSGTHPTYYKMFFLEVRQLKFEVDALLHLMLRFRRHGALAPYLPHVLMVQHIHMGNFYVLLFCSNSVCKLY